MQLSILQVDQGIAPVVLDAALTQAVMISVQIRSNSRLWAAIAKAASALMLKVVLNLTIFMDSDVTGGANSYIGVAFSGS